MTPLVLWSVIFHQEMIWNCLWLRLIITELFCEADSSSITSISSIRGIAEDLLIWRGRFKQIPEVRTTFSTWKKLTCKPFPLVQIWPSVLAVVLCVCVIKEPVENSQRFGSALRIRLKPPPLSRALASSLMRVSSGAWLIWGGTRSGEASPARRVTHSSCSVCVSWGGAGVGL